MTQPGVGPNTALAYVLTIGEVTRFARGKQVASYLGLIPPEESSGGRQKLGRSPSEAIGWCGRCRRKQPRLRCAAISDFANSICIVAIRSRKTWRKWQGAQVSGTTLLDATHRETVSRDRSHREQPACGPGRRKLDR